MSLLGRTITSSFHSREVIPEPYSHSHLLNRGSGENIAPPDRRPEFLEFGAQKGELSGRLHSRPVPESESDQRIWLVAWWARTSV
jgi:hypothetical protein